MFTDGTDYEAGPYNVIIPKGERSAELCINIRNDEELEDDEAFVIKINENNLHPDVVLMDPVETTVTIMDDECKHKDCTCQQEFISNIMYIAFHITQYTEVVAISFIFLEGVCN